MEPAAVNMERMTEAHLPEVLEIERLSFPIPFTENLFRMELKLSVARLFVAKTIVSEERFPFAANDEAQVAQMGGERRSPPTKIAGYIDFWQIGSEIHLITFAVRPDWRRRHVGTALFEVMLSEAKKGAVRIITLDVRASNDPALGLYRKFGFCQVGVRNNYYQDNHEDALVLSLSLGE